MAGHFRGLPDPANEDEATLLALFHDYELEMGGATRTLYDAFDGLGLSLALLAILVGFLGLLWLRVPAAPAGILRRVAGMNAVAAAALLLLGLPRLPPAMLVSFGAVGAAFLLAATGRVVAATSGADQPGPA
jgi:hypothetical protein